MNCVNILFLSDLHFKNKAKNPDYASQLEECAREYIKAISSLTTEWKPEIVAIAGDMGFEGKEEDYTFFDEAFFSPLVEALGIDSSDVIMCPGNHDKDDSRIPYQSDVNDVVWKNTKDIAADVQNYVFKGYRANCNEKRFVLDSFAVEPFRNYINFLKGKGIPKFSVDKYDYQEYEDADYLYGYRRIKGIDFYVYNSAWDCLHNDKKDKGNLRIGPVRRFTSKNERRDLSISLVHHPKEWLSVEPVSGAHTRKAGIDKEIDIAVHGHMHCELFFPNEECDVLYIQLPTWASNDTDFMSWKSFIIRVDLDDFSYRRMSIFWYRENGYIYPIHNISKSTYQLRPVIQLEVERRNNQDAIEFLYRKLLDKLEKYITQGDIDLLKEILDLISEIIRLAVNSTDLKSVNQIINTEKIIKMQRFNNIANPIINADLGEGMEQYDSIIEEANDLYREMKQGRSRVLTENATL